jgi:uncharacterized Zn finger protein
MQMTLANFEEIVEPKIVKRGYEYFNDDYISKVEQIGKGEFNALAYGTNIYDVYVKIEGENIVEHYCDCPYDWGDTCKHEVAVFYKIRNGDFVDIDDKINGLLDNLHDDALRRFVYDLLKKDRKFRQNFLREFDEDFEEDEDEDERFDEYNY